MAKPSTEARRAAIRALISKQPIATQADLHARLTAAGYVTTQATLSRDLAALGAVKERDAQDRLHYTLPEPLPAIAEQRLQRALRASQSRFERQDRNIAIHTQPGAAPAVAATLRQLPLPAVFLILGDDAAVLLICRTDQGTAATLQWLRRLRDERLFS